MNLEKVGGGKRLFQAKNNCQLFLASSLLFGGTLCQQTWEYGGSRGQGYKCRVFVKVSGLRSQCVPTFCMSKCSNVTCIHVEMFKCNRSIQRELNMDKAKRVVLDEYYSCVSQGVASQCCLFQHVLCENVQMYRLRRQFGIFRRKIVWERKNYQICNILEIEVKRPSLPFYS